MEALLEEYYRYDLHNAGYIERKTVILEDESVHLVGISQSGKTSLIKNFLLSHKKSSYLYVDCSDMRINIDEFNALLPSYCSEHKISIVAMDNWNSNFNLPDGIQSILASRLAYESGIVHTKVNLLDFEEFLAFESRYDETALSHYLQLGSFPAMHRIPSEDRMVYLQKLLSNALNDIEFSILVQSSKMITQKVSAFAIYERLKSERKISKDKLYAELDSLFSKEYLLGLQKFNHPGALKKLYLCDIALKNALTLQKHFGRLFENLVFLELYKHDIECYYEEGIDFYLPARNPIVLAVPFANEHALFKKIESLEAFIVLHRIEEVIAVTMNHESSLSHPIAQISLIPFSQWALGEE